MRELIDLSPDVVSFEKEVVDGLRASPKLIPCKYFYDERGSQLFTEICELPEYYPTRTEVSILEASVADMAERLGPECLLLEYGSGAGIKTLILLDELVDPAGYVPIDISREALLESAARLRERYPEIVVLPVCADYTAEFELPAGATPPGRKAVFFPGSTIGNFHPPEAYDFLRRIARLVGTGGALLIGVDLKKDPRILERAYNDDAGITADFNLNLLRRINRELGADFEVERFEHRAVYNATRGRIEMHLVSRGAQRVEVGGEVFSFRSGETIWTENSYKYSIRDFEELAGRAGFEVVEVWTDDDDLFSVQILTVS